MTSLQIWATVHCWSNSNTILAILPPEARLKVLRKTPHLYHDSLYVHLELEQVDLLLVGTTQGEDVPGLP